MMTYTELVGFLLVPSAYAHEDGTPHAEPAESEAQACMGLAENNGCNVTIDGAARGGRCLPASCKAGEGTPAATNSAGYYDCLWCTVAGVSTTSLSDEGEGVGGGGLSCATSQASGNLMMLALGGMVACGIVARRRFAR